MDTTTEVLIEKRSVYGNDLIYPLSHVKEIRALTDTKTLSARHIEALQVLGISFIERSMVVLQTHN